MKSEKENLEKQLAMVNTELTNSYSDTETSLKNALSQKNHAFIDLRDSFEEVITQKDNVINVLRNKVNELRDQQLSASNSKKNEVESAQNLLKKKEAEFKNLKENHSELERQRDWLKSELDHVINEKDNIGGVIRNQFEDISSGLRSDVELALKERQEIESSFQINRLELERTIVTQKDELSSLQKKVSDNLTKLEQKNIVISELQGRLEKAAEILSKEQYYENLEQRLVDADTKLREATIEIEDLTEDLNDAVRSSSEFKIQVEKLSNEKNEVRVDLETKMEEVLLEKAEYCQNLRASFDERIEEKEKKIAELEKNVTEQEKERDKILEQRQKTLEEKYVDAESNFKTQIATLEDQLDSLVRERENKVNQILVNTEQDKMFQLKAVRDDFERLLEGKDSKIKNLYSQFSESQQACNKFEEELSDMKKKVKLLAQKNSSLISEQENFERINKDLKYSVNSEIEKVIISKGQQLKELRLEFEAAFNEKNEINENLRSILKELRSELSSAQRVAANASKDAKDHEQKVVEAQTEVSSVQAQLKLSSDANQVLQADMDQLTKTRDTLKHSLEEIQLKCTDLEKLDENSKQDNSRLAAEIITLTEEKEESTAKVSKLDSEVSTLRRQLDEIMKAGENSSSINTVLKEGLTVEQQKRTELERELASALTDLRVAEKVLKNIDEVLRQGLTHNLPSDGSFSNTHELVRNLLTKLTTTQKYNDELSHKIFELTEEQTLDDTLHINELELHIGDLQNQLNQAEADRDNAIDIAQERFNDILGNLREDLTNLQTANKALQEENFSMKSQLDVFTNVNSKRIQEMQAASTKPTEMQRPSFVSQYPDESPGLTARIDAVRQRLDSTSDLNQSGDTSPIRDNLRLEFIDSYRPETSISAIIDEQIPKPQVEEEMQSAATTAVDESVLTPQDSGDVEMKKNVAKLKKMCRKYKEEAQTLRDSKASLENEVLSLKQVIESGSETVQSDRVRQQMELRDLRSEIEQLVTEKSTLAASFRKRLDDEISKQQHQFVEVKRMYEERLKQADDQFSQFSRDSDENLEMITNLKVSAEERNQVLETELQVKTQETLHLQEANSQLNENLDKIKSLLNTRDQDITTLQSLVEDKSKALSALQEVLNVVSDTPAPKEHLDISIDTPDWVLAEKLENDEKLGQLELLVGTLTEENNNTKIENERLEKTIASLTETVGGDTLNLHYQNSALTERLEAMTQSRNQSEANLRSLREEMSTLVAEREKLAVIWKARMAELDNERQKFQQSAENEMERLTSELAQSQTEVSLLNETIQDLDEKLAADQMLKEKEGDRLDNIINDLGKARLFSDSLQNEIDLKVVEVASLQKQISNKEADLADLRKICVQKDESESKLKESFSRLESDILKEKNLIRRLTHDLVQLKSEKEQLEQRLHKEVSETLGELVTENNTLKESTFSQDKTIQDLRRELSALVREKEFLTASLKEGHKSEVITAVDVDYLKFQVQQGKEEKLEADKAFDQLADKLRQDLEEVNKGKAHLQLHMATLRAMLEQEVKDHEKTKFYKEQVMQSRSVALDRLRGSLSGVKNNLHSLRAGLGNSMIELRQECEKSVMQMVPAILSVQRRKPEPISEDSLAVVRSENLQLKDVLRRRLDEFVEKDQLVAELDRAKNLAESRLRDLADVLHEMGAIKLVQVRTIW